MRMSRLCCISFRPHKFVVRSINLSFFFLKKNGFWNDHIQGIERCSINLRHSAYIYIYIYRTTNQLRSEINLQLKKRCFFTSTLYLQLALATHARFKYAMYRKRDSLERHQATQPCKRMMYIYLVLSFDF